MKGSSILFKWIFLRILFLAFFLVALLLIIAFARGYRFDIEKKTVTSTGIISVNSNPEPAKVYVNGELKGVTDIDLTLPHGTYQVEVKKDGFTEWRRTIGLKGEIVMSINAMLFSKNPSLTPLTNLGIAKAINIGQTENILLVSDAGDFEKDGIYLFEGTKKTISIFPPLKPILLKSNLPEGTDLATLDVNFSPEFDQGIFSFTSGEAENSYLISLTDNNIQLQDVTLSKNTLLNAWNKERNRQVLKILETFPKKLRNVATSSVELVAISPDETKFLYVAKRSVDLPRIIQPPLIGSNQTPESRSIELGKVYIYDKKEDKNFLLKDISSIEQSLNEKIITPSPTMTESLLVDPEATTEPELNLVDESITNQVLSQVHWFPDSRHLITRTNNQIAVMEYDGENKVVVYSGPLKDNFYASTSSYNLIVVANLNPLNNKNGDLYAIGIR